MSTTLPRRLQPLDRSKLSPINTSKPLVASPTSIFGENGVSPSPKHTDASFSSAGAPTAILHSASSKAINIDIVSMETSPGRPRSGTASRKVIPVDLSSQSSPLAGDVTERRPSGIRPGTPSSISSKPVTPNGQASAQQAAQFALHLVDEEARSGTYSPRTLMLIRARQNHDKSLRSLKAPSKLSRPARRSDYGLPTEFKLTAATFRDIKRKRDIPRLGQRHPKPDDACVCVFLWRRWLRERAEADQQRREFIRMVNSPVFYDGPCGHVVRMCGCGLPSVVLTFTVVVQVAPWLSVLV